MHFVKGGVKMDDNNNDIKKREESLRTLQKRMESREATRQKLLAELQKLKDDDVADVKAYEIKYRKKRTHMFCTLAPGLITVLGLPKDDHTLGWLQNTNDDVQYFIDSILKNEYYLNNLRKIYRDVLVHRSVEAADKNRECAEYNTQNNATTPQN